MSSEPPNTDDSDGPTTDETNEVETAATVSSDYKTRGKKAATSGAGVLGYNTATSGEAYGVEGVTDSSDFNAAAVRAIANNGAVGLETTANGNYAVDAFTSGYTAIDGTTDGGGYNGLKGQNNATTGYSWGVRGDTESAHSNAHGVKGYNNNSNGSGNGVSGTTYGSGDGATGVHGEAFAGSGVTFGVDGVTNSSDSGAVGVRGSTPEDNQGVMGQSYDTESNLPSLTSSESAGVFGRTDKSGADYGIVGWSKNSDGVLARSDDVNSAGIVVSNSTDGGPGIQVNDSHVNINDTGVSAYLSANFTIQSAITTQVPFDAEEADHFGGFNKSTGTYTIPVDGDYHVDFTIRWADPFSSGDTIIYRLRVNGSTAKGIYGDTDVKGSGEVTRGYSKALFGLSAGADIDLEVYQTSGSDKDIYGDSSSQHTYLTIHKIG